MGDNELDSVIRKVVRALGIEDELLKAAETLPKSSCEASKRIAEELSQYLKSSILTAPDYWEKIHSLTIWYEVPDIRTRDR